jgi:hypothetical protein
MVSGDVAVLYTVLHLITSCLPLPGQEMEPCAPFFLLRDTDTVGRCYDKRKTTEAQVAG